MRKIHLVVFAVLVVAAFSAFMASSAFAVTQWLEDGAVINAGEVLPVDVEGELRFTNQLFGIKTPIDCSGLFEGTVESGGKGTATDVFDLSSPQVIAGTLDSADTNKTPVSCEVLGGGCTSGSLANVWTVKLNLELGAVWKTQLVLVGSAFIDELGAEAGYELECKGSLGTITTECIGTVTKAELTNETGGVLAKALGTEKITCTVGEATGSGEGLVSIAGKTLSVSDV
ncbi:MAG TPA: hypothetical protein VGI26_07215 [Solirubrobacteraceae bacterium]|jgi:hypothetical protein